MVRSMRTSHEAARILEVSIADHPGEPSTARRDVILYGLGLCGGQPRARPPLPRKAPVGPSGMAVGLDALSV